MCVCVRVNVMCMKHSPFHVAPRRVRLLSPMIRLGVVAAQIMYTGNGMHLRIRQTYFLGLICVAVVTLTPTLRYPFVSPLVCLQQR